MNSSNNENDLPEEVSANDNECCPITRAFSEMTGHLEEGGPEVAIDDVIAYVHQFLPPLLNDQVSRNIVQYRAWNQAYRDAMRERVKIDRIIKKSSSDGESEK